MCSIYYMQTQVWSLERARAHSLSIPPLFARINPGGQVTNTNIHIYDTCAECTLAGTR